VNFYTSLQLEGHPKKEEEKEEGITVSADGSPEWRHGVIITATPHALPLQERTRKVPVDGYFPHLGSNTERFFFHLSIRIKTLSELSSNMRCAVCETIPLDLFLPTSGCWQSYPDGDAWLGSMYHSRLEHVQQSGAKGCVICRLLLSALGTDKSVDSVPPEERPRDTHVSLQCVGEGRLRVSEYGEGYPVRTGNLYWFNEGMKLGRRPGESGA
jgi:hypothetical protein